MRGHYSDAIAAHGQRVTHAARQRNPADAIIPGGNHDQNTVIPAYLMASVTEGAAASQKNGRIGVTSACPNADIDRIGNGSRLPCRNIHPDQSTAQ